MRDIHRGRVEADYCPLVSGKLTPSVKGVSAMSRRDRRLTTDWAREDSVMTVVSFPVHCLMLSTIWAQDPCPSRIINYEQKISEQTIDNVSLENTTIKRAPLSEQSPIDNIWLYSHLNGIGNNEPNIQLNEAIHSHILASLIRNQTAREIYSVNYKGDFEFQNMLIS